MKIVHWSLSNTSGLNRMATQLSAAEKAIGLDSHVSYTDGGEGPSLSPGVFSVLPNADAYNADIHCMHSWIPPEAQGKRVFFAHGTPEHCFQMAVEQGKTDYTGGDPLMLSYYNIDNTETTVTFWDRHKYIWQTFNPKADVVSIPMGVDKSIWKKEPTKGKWVGTPSVFLAENCHTIKWPLDGILAWPYIMKRNPGATMHIHYIPHDLHRFFYPLIFKTGVSYKSYTSGSYFGVDALKNAFNSVDYYLSLVKYGDHNTIAMEAKSCGAKLISYRGNPYADYWITEGDQRVMAEDLLAIFSGEAEQLDASPIPDIAETAQAMKIIYERTANG